jgi:NADPH-dependent 2,4-dienoyl-CoA reductase/sulfur reductase-like enzyme
VILATGARELFLPYPGWTLPNAMGIGGAQAMLKAGLDVCGKRVIIAGSGPLMLPVAAAMTKAGARLIVVAEQTPARRLGAFAISLWSQPAKLMLAARYRLAMPMDAHRMGTWVERADGTGRVETVTLTSGRRRWVEQCDLLCCSYGLIPCAELARLFGCAIADGRVVVDEMQRTTVPGVFSAGEATGVAGDAAAIAEGEIAGVVASSDSPAFIPPDLRRRQKEGQRFALRLRETFRLREALRTLAAPDTIVCRCEDVRLSQLDPSWSGRQAKLYTRAGMGPCQGAVCGPALEHLFKWQPGSVRPPLFAPSLGAWMSAETMRDTAATNDAKA